MAKFGQLGPPHPFLAQGAPTEFRNGSNPFGPSEGEPIVYFCEHCKHQVPPNIGAGQNCPFCGAFFATATTADGRLEAAEVRNEIAWNVIANLIAALVGAIVLGRAYYRWRRSSTPDERIGS